MRTLLIACFLFSLLPGALRATDVPAVPRVVSLRVLALKGLVTDLAVRSPQGRSRVVARASAFGPGINALVEDGAVNFFGYRPAHPAPSVPSATPPEPPVARFIAEPGVNHYLVIVAATGEGAKRRFSTYAIPDTEEALLPGHACVANFTNGSLAVQLGTGSAVVAASRSSVLPCPPGPDGHADLRLARPAGEGGWKLVDSTRVAVPDGRRLLVLVTPAPPPDGEDLVAGGVFNVRVVFDGPPPAGSATLAGQARATP